MSAEKKLPAGWEVKRLGDVCEFINGRAYKREELLPLGKYPVLRVGNFFTNENWYYSDLELDEEKYCDKGDLLYAWSASFGPRIWTGEKTIFHYHIWKIKVNDELIAKKYLFNYLNWDTDQLKKEFGTGTTMTHVGKGSIETRNIPLPPLSEQKRIVAILDEAFQAIGKAKENAQKNLANARELFEGYLNQVFSNPGKDWEETTLGDEVELLCGFAFKSTSYSVNPSDVPLLRGDNIMQGYLRWDDAKRWPTKDAVAYSRYFLEENDIVLAMDRPWVKAGLKCAKITRDVLPALLVQRVARLRIKNLNSDFLFGVIQSQQFTKHLLELQNGIGVPHISGDQILSFAFHKPTKAQQTEVIHNINQLKDETKRLESIYTKKLAALDELKKSILQKAFSGEL